MNENPFMKKSLLAISLLIIISGCTKDNILIDPDNPLIGIWSYSDYQDNTHIFSRNNELIDDHCYNFRSDGTLTERKNSGWCGTPPIAYADYPGTWTLLNDTLIQVDVGYWGGTMRYKLDIEYLDSRSLKTIYISED
jgi:hypothetical protein